MIMLRYFREKEKENNLLSKKKVKKRNQQKKEVPWQSLGWILNYLNLLLENNLFIFKDGVAWPVSLDPPDITS